MLNFKKIVMLGLIASVFVSPLASCVRNYEDIPDAGGVLESPKEPDEDNGEPVIIEPRFRQYVLQPEELVEPEGFLGSMHVVVGKNGYLYENGYINEYLGAAHKYVDVTDDFLINRAEVLKDIQEELEIRGIAFCVVISPSKAGSHPEFIPDFHKEAYPTISADYVRPYVRLLQLLKDNDVYHVDSQTVYKSIGMTNVFPKTGIHWNLMAAFETVDAIVTEYERQRGHEVRRLIADSIQSQENPYGNERDIFNIVYNSGEGRRHLDNAIVDEKYYRHDVYLEPGGGKPKIGSMIIQGGSFTGELNHFFGGHGLAESTRGFYYNNNNDVNIDWERELKNIDFVILEVNEQNVYDMGGNAQAWAENDLVRTFDYNRSNNIIDSLREYLRK